MSVASQHIQNIADRFWESVDQSGGPDACWQWIGPIHRQGHGTFPVPGIWSSPPAHRIAYHLTAGVPPQGHVVWRTCGNPLCVNPAHLQAGDRSTFRRSIQKR